MDISMVRGLPKGHGTQTHRQSIGDINISWEDEEKKSKKSPWVTTWMNLEDAMLSEVC